MKNSWIQTYTGKQFFPFNPDKESIDIEDIAHALSNICRYTGHSKYFYSVAEHSVYVSRLLNKKYSLAGLLHDAAEAYLSDVARPIKPYLKLFNETEDKLLDIIFQKFSLDNIKEVWNNINYCDLQILALERNILMESKHDWQIDNVELPTIEIKCLQPQEARLFFKKEYEKWSS